MKNTYPFLLCVLFILTSALGVSALRPGDFDPTFGSAGKVYNLPANFMPGEDVAIQADGKLVLVGSTLGPDNTQDFGVVRLNANGTPDTGFGNNGLVGIPFDANFNESGVAVVIQADGKIVVAGNVQLGGSGWDFGIARLNTNGTLDGTYAGGKVKVGVSNGGGDDFVADMALQSDGKVVIVGSTRPTPNKDVAVVRMQTTGVLDTRLTVAGQSGTEEEGLAVAVQNDGMVVVAGVFAGDFMVIRLMPALGGLDPNFGTGGLVLTPVGSQLDRATSVAIQSDGKIVVGGTANSGSFDEFAFARYTTGGLPDTTFDGDGKVSYDVRASNSDVLASVLIQPDGKIIGVGASGGSYVLVRLNTGGGFDSTFGTAGIAVRGVAPTTSTARRAILQPDGNIVAVGDGSGPGTNGFTAGRFLTTGTSAAPFDFDGDGKTDIAIFRPPPTGQWWINSSSTGATTAYVFGTASEDRMVPGDYTGDGKTDIAIWRVGTWYVLRSETFTFYAFPWGLNGDVTAPADYDGDGKVDPAVFRPSTNAWYILRSTGGSYIEGFGTTGDVPVASDYDGDGKADIAIFRPSNGQWWINRSTAGILAVAFGTGTDRPTPGDFTGDGKSDVAFWRPSTGDWGILRSENFSFYGFPFGISTDIPGAGDYDGDGKWDAAVFRPSQATWYIQRSTAGTLITAFGASNDLPVPSAYVR